MREDRRGRHPSDPTPREIRERAAEIRKQWKWPETFCDRAGINPMSLEVRLDRDPVSIFGHDGERIGC